MFLKAISISMRIWSPFITYNIIYFHNVNNIEFLSGKVYYYFYQCDFFSFLSVYESLSLINFFIFGCLYLNFIILKWFFEIIHSLCLFFCVEWKIYFVYLRYIYAIHNTGVSSYLVCGFFQWFKFLTKVKNFLTKFFVFSL